MPALVETATGLAVEFACVDRSHCDNARIHVQNSSVVPSVLVERSTVVEPRLTTFPHGVPPQALRMNVDSTCGSFTAGAASEIGRPYRGHSAIVRTYAASAPPPTILALLCRHDKSEMTQLGAVSRDSTAPFHAIRPLPSRAAGDQRLRCRFGRTWIGNDGADGPNRASPGEFRHPRIGFA